jgi:hypothetical protein
MSLFIFPLSLDGRGQGEGETPGGETTVILQIRVNILR